MFAYYSMLYEIRSLLPCRYHRKNAIFMKWGADYFNYRIVKTADLPADRNYIVGSHPHGMLCLGMTQSFASYVAGITELYTGFKTWTVTLWGQFLYPLRRELLMIGGRSRLLANCRLMHFQAQESRQAVTIVVGGLNECLMSQPGKYRLKLKDRKGFIKLALTEGADLVPMFHFGENETYKPVFGICEKRLRNMQCHLMHTFGFCPPVLVGRSLVGLPWGGLVPFQVRMESVIGDAIRVEKNPNPTQQEIDELHHAYCKQLINLFETHKSNYGIRPDQRIILY
ncbi:hypothetical protein PFISCL1PPCAC_13071, partial [Pristionchus fissidentatus]